jgi:hypothetical protein
MRVVEPFVALSVDILSCTLPVVDCRTFMSRSWTMSTGRRLEDVVPIQRIFVGRRIDDTTRAALHQ